MCEKRTKRIIKKGSEKTRLREARRLQRIAQVALPTLQEKSRPIPCPQAAALQEAQNQALVELAYKTMALMHKNTLIQEKIDSLKRETSEFLAIIMSDPESRRQYLENLRLQGSPVPQAEASSHLNPQIKLEKS